MRLLAAMFILLIVPRPTLGQVPGTNLTVKTKVTAVSMHGDTAYVTYVLLNDATSAERMFRFMVDAPSRPVYLSLPTPAGGWSSGKTFGERSVARWAALGQRMLPGQESPALTQRAIGLPGIVISWVRGYTPPSEEIPSDTVALQDPPSVTDSTVGVDRFPLLRTASSFLARLDSLLNQTCGAALAWITSSTVCSSLGGKLDLASQKLSQADTTGTEVQLQSFLSELETQHGAGLPVSDSAYWLLKANAEYILSQL